MQSLLATIGITTYNLTSGAPLTMLEIDGIAAPAARPLSERGPLQDGDTDLGFRLEPRTVSLALQGITTASYTSDTIRDLINRLFKPSNVPIYLDVVRDDASVRRLMCRSLGEYSLPQNIMAQLYAKTVITLRAADPLFYNPAMQALSFGIAAGSTGFLIPMPVPTKFGTSVVNQNIPLAYAGTFREYPVIQIYGPITSPVITNQTTGDKIDFTGITIAAGDWYTVDLRYGRKFAYRNGVTTDIRTGEATTDSDFATFSIEADPEASGGVNDIKVTGSAANSVTQVYVQYFERYVSA